MPMVAPIFSELDLSVRHDSWGTSFDMGSPMANQYRIRAAEFHAQAQSASNPKLRAQFENLSLAYLRLAEQADRNSQTELIYEPPPPKLDSPKS